MNEVDFLLLDPKTLAPVLSIELDDKSHQSTAAQLTLATFKPMAQKLQKHFSTLAHKSPDEFAKYEAL